jgi:CBS domain-containing protein
MACTIDRLVRESIAILDENSSVQQAVTLMADRNAGSLVVTRNDEVVGLFTERDLVKRVVAQGKDPLELRLADVATTTALVKVSHDTSCQEAIHKMQGNACRRLMVYRGDRFVGLVSLPSVAYALAEQSTGKNLVANVFVWLGVAVAVSVILIMLYLFPDMLHVARDATGN